MTTTIEEKLKAMDVLCGGNIAKVVDDEICSSCRERMYRFGDYSAFCKQYGISFRGWRIVYGVSSKDRCPFTVEHLMRAWQ